MVGTIGQAVEGIKEQGWKRSYMAVLRQCMAYVSVMSFPNYTKTVLVLVKKRLIRVLGSLFEFRLFPGHI